MLLYGQIFKHKVKSHEVIKDPDKYSVCEIVGVLRDSVRQNERTWDIQIKGVSKYRELAVNFSSK